MKVPATEQPRSYRAETTAVTEYSRSEQTNDYPDGICNVLGSAISRKLQKWMHGKPAGQTG